MSETIKIEMVKIIDPFNENATRYIPKSDLKPWHKKAGPEDAEVGGATAGAVAAPRGPIATERKATAIDPSTVSIPDDYEKRPWPDLRGLCAELTDEPVVSKANALQIIRNELERRKTAPAQSAETPQEQPQVAAAVVEPKK